jgi:pilus assembly protein FimV
MPKEGYAGVAALIGAVLAAVVAGLAMRRRRQASASADAGLAASAQAPVGPAPETPPSGEQAAATAYGAMARERDADAHDPAAVSEPVVHARSAPPDLPEATRDDAAGHAVSGQPDTTQRVAPHGQAAPGASPAALGGAAALDSAAARVSPPAALDEHRDGQSTPAQFDEAERSAADARQDLDDSIPDLHEQIETAHPAAAPVRELPTLTLDLPPVAAAVCEPAGTGG